MGTLDNRVAIVTGAGDKAFCAGADMGDLDELSSGRTALPAAGVRRPQTFPLSVPKPVIARVQGFAIGGGNVLCTICDLTIASEKAIFGQVGPKMGSVDPGYGTAFLARVVGENFRDGVPVIMNLSEMDDTDAKRLVDFSAGLVFALHGSIERVTGKVFLLTPSYVEVVGHPAGGEDETDDHQED